MRATESRHRPAGSGRWLGILMLDTRFPRPPGDIGNPVTFERLGIPVRHLVVRGAAPAAIVRGRDPAALAPFLAAARALAAEGAALLSTSCGFLVRHQAELQAAVAVPVVSSSLLQCAGLPAPGIVTIDAAALDPATLAAAGVAPGTPVAGVAPGSSFQRAILGDEPALDPAAACADVVAAARSLQARAPALGSIVLECTNMPPYHDAVAAACGVPVHDIVSLLAARWQALGSPGGDPA
ncbi:MAG: aspartate/glutamate racemase family protein [Lautropia sp.]